MLSAYLNAAKTVVQQKQARPGVAVHVRLGGDTEGGEKEGSDGVGRNGVASSYAVWAVTGKVSTNPVRGLIVVAAAAGVCLLCRCGYLSIGFNCISHANGAAWASSITRVLSYCV